MITCDRKECGKKYREGGMTLKNPITFEVYQLCGDCKKELWNVILRFLDGLPHLSLTDKDSGK